jgi:O-antigen ligase
MAHNDYVHFAAELGLFLPVIIVWMTITLFRHGFKKLKSRSLLTRGISLGSMAGIFAIFFHSFIDFNLHIPANALIFTVLVAFVAAPEKTKAQGTGFKAQGKD